MDTDGGGWTVIHRRFDGSVSFERNWAECESGFGNKTGEYWLGLSYIHRLTTSASQDLRVDMEDFEGGSAYACYTTFNVAIATDGYRLLQYQYQDYSGTSYWALPQEKEYIPVCGTRKQHVTAKLYDQRARGSVETHTSSSKIRGGAEVCTCVTPMSTQIIFAEHNARSLL